MRTTPVTDPNPLTLIERERERFQDPGLRDKLVAWLCEELAEDHETRLERRNGENIPLPAIFMDIEAVPQPPADPLKASGHGLAEEVLGREPSPLRAELPARGPWSTSRSEGSGLLLIAGPGQGKSTLTQYLAQRHRAALLEPVHAQLTPKQQAIRSAWVEHPLPTPRTLCLPVRLQLPLFAAWMHEHERESESEDPQAIWGYLAERIGEAKGNAAAPEPGDLLALLNCVPLLLIFDGLDEVMEAREHGRMIEAIEGLHRQLCEREGAALLIATTRPQNYGGQLSASFASRYLLPLTREQGLAHARVLIEELHPEERGRRDEAMARLKAAYEDPATARLMQTPLQLSIMADLVDDIGDLPRQRWQLFSEYETTLSNRERRKSTGFAELMHEHRQDVEDVLRHLGLLLHVHGEHGSQLQASFTSKQLAVVIEARLADVGHERDTIHKLARRIMAIALRRLVFLVELSKGRYGFELRPLQEFMAAKALCHGRERDVQARLSAVALSAAWHNVVLFAASKFAAERSPLSESLVEMCSRYNDPERGPLSAALRGGSALALAILRDRSIHSPRHEEQLARVAVQLLELPPTEEHVALGQLGGRVDGVLEEALKGSPPDGESVGKWVVLAQLCDREVGWAEELARGCWPEDNQQRIDVLWTILKMVSSNRWVHAQITTYAADLDPRDIYFWRGDGPHTSPVVADGWGDRLLIDLPSGRDDIQSYGPIHISSISERGREQWGDIPSLLESADLHFAWRPVLAISPFATNPKPETLAHTLRQLSEDFDPELLRWWSRYAPWPLGGFMAVVERTEQLQAWAEEVESGAYGDLQNWLEHEARWREDGIEFQAFVSTLGTWPFLAAIQDHNGGPTLAHYAPFEHHSILALTPAAPNNTYELVRDHARWEAYFRGQFRGQPAAEELSAEAFAKLYIRTRLARLLEMLGSLARLLASYSDADVSHIMDEIGRHVDIVFVGWASNHTVVQRLVRLFCEDPTRVGILHVLARVAMHAEVGLPRELIMGELPAPPRFRSDVLALQVEHASSTEELAELLSTAGDLRAERSWSLVQTLLRVSAKPALNAPDSLARLYPLIAKLASPTTNHALRNFRERLATLPTGLRADPRWHLFELPVPAPSTLERTQTWLSRVTIQNLRAFERLTLEPPEPSHDGGQWVVLLGENSVGKSTLLRAIVLALVEHEDAYGLVDRAKAPYLRSGAAHAFCTVNFDGAKYSLTVTNDQGHERVVAPQARGLERPFVLAYGCARGSASSGETTSYARVDRVATLFDDGARLIPAQTWMQELHTDAFPEPEPGARELYDTVCETLEELLPGVERVDVRGAGLLFSGDKIGERVPLAALSDGYITTAGWLIDLLARWVQRSRERGEALPRRFNREMRGLVVMDEIDLHLHPRWQREVIAKVRQWFPQMSFIVTTHNPLTLLSARKGEVFVLERARTGDEDKETLRAVQLDLPPGIRADQVLTGEWFGLASTRDADTLKLLESHYRHLEEGLASDDPEYVRVHDQLREHIEGFPGTTFEQLVRHVAAQLHLERYPKPTPARLEQMRSALKQRVQELAPQGEVERGDS